jgi:pyridinium-3,5-biscarboxylic acid mononucleotide sulfurtransferase
MMQWDDSHLTAEDKSAWQRLVSLLQENGHSIVAFSGGVDSAVLAAALYQVAGDHMLAIMVDSPVHITADREAAQAVAAEIGFPFLVIPFDDLAQEQFCENPVNRCYVCKFHRFDFLVNYAKEHEFTAVMEGSNLDDEGDYRPGIKAVKELGVMSPLAMSGIRKDQIRRFAHAMHILVWNRPSAPCLATRFTYGTKISRSALDDIREAEAFLNSLGLHAVRVRYDGKNARIEVQKDELASVLAQRQSIVSKLKSLGFVKISLDLEGYRLGSNNEGYIK